MGKRISIKIPVDLYQRIKDYQEANRLRSFAQALHHLLTAQIAHSAQLHKLYRSPPTQDQDLELKTECKARTWIATPKGRVYACCRNAPNFHYIPSLKLCGACLYRPRINALDWSQISHTSPIRIPKPKTTYPEIMGAIVLCGPCLRGAYKEMKYEISKDGKIYVWCPLRHYEHIAVPVESCFYCEEAIIIQKSLTQKEYEKLRKFGGIYKYPREETIAIWKSLTMTAGPDLGKLSFFK